MIKILQNVYNGSSPVPHKIPHNVGVEQFFPYGYVIATIVVFLQNDVSPKNFDINLFYIILHNLCIL